jgi:hypothetical protein
MTTRKAPRCAKCTRRLASNRGVPTITDGRRYCCRCADRLPRAVRQAGTTGRKDDRDAVSVAVVHIPEELLK